MHINILIKSYYENSYSIDRFLSGTNVKSRISHWKYRKLFSRLHNTVVTVCFISQSFISITAWAQNVPGCGSLDNAYGPYDYTNPVHKRDKLNIVEGYHFTSEVENLEKGISAHLPGPDLDYTLRAFPNHHRALYSMARYQLQHPTIVPPPGASYSAECWFKRAMQFKPDDGTIYVIYGIYLHKKGELSNSLTQYKHAIDIIPESSELHYNMGLLYIDLKDYNSALTHAKSAYDLGYPLPGLRRKLERLGVWK